MQHRLDDCRESLRSLGATCRQDGLQLMVESPLPHLGHVDEFAWLLAQLDESVGVCLDTGHTALGHAWGAFLAAAGVSALESGVVMESGSVVRSSTSRVAGRVLLIDGHVAARRGVRLVLDGAPEFSVCGEAGSLASGLTLLAAQRPDIVILDLSLPDDDSEAVVRAVHAVHPAGRILVFSMLEERFHASRAFQHGASGYLMKHASAEELLRALRSVARGRRYVSARMAEQLLSTREGHIGARGDIIAPLVRRFTRRQQQVLALLAEGLTPSAIAESLDMSVKTVDTHCAHIKARVGLKSARDLLCYAVATNLG